MKEKGSNVKDFWQSFKKAAIESGVNDTVAEWYVNWSQRFAKSIKGTPLRSRSKKDVMDFLHSLSIQKGMDEWQVRQAAKALEFLYRDFLNIDLGIDPEKYLRDEGSSKKNTESFIFKDTVISQQDIVSRYNKPMRVRPTHFTFWFYSLESLQFCQMCRSDPVVFAFVFANEKSQAAPSAFQQFAKGS